MYTYTDFNFKQDPNSKYFHVKGKQHGRERHSSCTVQLPYDVPPSPYTKDGMLHDVADNSCFAVNYYGLVM